MKFYSHCKICFKYLTLLTLCLSSVNCTQNSSTFTQNYTQIQTLENAVDINSASSKELETLPGVGEKTARKIIEYRKKFGKFRRVEHLILVDGISDRRFRKMRSMIKVR